jgi:hypothetical protein
LQEASCELHDASIPGVAGPVSPAGRRHSGRGGRVARHEVVPRNPDTKFCRGQSRLGFGADRLGPSSPLVSGSAPTALSALQAFPAAGGEKGAEPREIVDIDVPLRLPTRPDDGYGFPSPVGPTPCPGIPPPDRVSQVPRLICRRPPSPPTPGSPAAARARCFAAGIRLHLFRKDGHSHLRNEAEPDSRFRITADAFAFPGSDGEVTRAAAGSASW